MPNDPATSAALRASESRYRRLFEAAQDGILLINAETAQIEDANPYLIQLLGSSHARMLGKKLWEVGAFADRAKSEEMFELQVTGYVRYDDLPLKTRSGELINVEFVSNAYDCEGVRVIQCNIRNVTEQRRAEEQVRKLSLVVEQSPQASSLPALTPKSSTSTKRWCFAAVATSDTANCWATTWPCCMRARAAGRRCPRCATRWTRG
jgi:PAS domain S-box-containing protein